MGFSEDVDAWARTQSRRQLVTVYVVALALSFFADVATVMQIAGNSTAALFDKLGDFKHDSADIALLFGFRIATLVLLGAFACLVGVPRADERTQHAAMLEPLLHQPPSSRVDQAHVDHDQQIRRADARKAVVLTASLVVTAAVQLHIGIKALSFECGADDESRQATMFGLLVLLMNLETWLLHRLVHAITAPQGFSSPALHRHRLNFSSRPGSSCDMCEAKAPFMYYCPQCDFDVCSACFNKKDDTLGEGKLRGDKGIKRAGEQSSLQFVRQAWVLLVLPNTTLILCAVSCLVANSAVGLLLPNLQGDLFDALFAGRASCVASHASDCTARKGTFVRQIVLYALLSLGKGLFTGLQELSFELLGPRVVTRVQSLVFSTAVVQDIAFFDGVRVGDLISRLDRDCYYTVRPLEDTLSTSLSGLISMVGGALMCLYTSWRLSLLAFTSMLPVAYATHAYASWSGKINREIVQHYADAASVAHEALSNIRTVRSVSSESGEVQKHRASLEHALRKGTRDALLGSAATMFNAHLDLGCSVMMLWCGEPGWPLEPALRGPRVARADQTRDSPARPPRQLHQRQLRARCVGSSRESLAPPQAGLSP